MADLKARVALLSIFIMWLYLIILDAPYMVWAYFYDKKHKPPPRMGRLHSILLAQDIYVNAQLGGYFRTTISSELGNQSKSSKSGKLAANVVDYLFEIAGDGPNHCINAIEAEDKHYFNAPYASISLVLWVIPRILIILILFNINLL